METLKFNSFFIGWNFVVEVAIVGSYYFPHILPKSSKMVCTISFYHSWFIARLGVNFYFLLPCTLSKRLCMEGIAICSNSLYWGGSAVRFFMNLIHQVYAHFSWYVRPTIMWLSWKWLFTYAWLTHVAFSPNNFIGTKVQTFGIWCTR